jgi:hypothetical protein
VDNFLKLLSLMHLQVCIRVLELDPRNVKGLLRAARASLALHEYEETEACVKRVSSLCSPSNAVVAVP